MCVCVCTCGLPPSTYFLSFTHVQVPSHDNMTPEEALKHFQQEIPALGLLGTPHQIHCDTPYTVDDGVQLVCKYLKALQVGGKGGIDRLYQEGDEIALCACIAAIFFKIITNPHSQMVFMLISRSNSAPTQICQMKSASSCYFSTCQPTFEMLRLHKGSSPSEELKYSA